MTTALATTRSHFSLINNPQHDLIRRRSYQPSWLMQIPSEPSISSQPTHHAAPTSAAVPLATLEARAQDIAGPSDTGSHRHEGASSSHEQQSIVPTLPETSQSGRTLCVRHQIMADQGVNGKLQKVGHCIHFTFRHALFRVCSANAVPSNHSL